MRHTFILLAGAAAVCLSGGLTAQTTPETPQPTQQPPDEPPAQEPTQQPTQPTPDEPAPQQPPDQMEPADEAQQPDSSSQAGQVTKATAADIKAGASVYDSSGELVGKIDSVESDGAVVNTGTVKAKLALSSFGLNKTGLVIGMSRAELEAAAKTEEPQ